MASTAMASAPSVDPSNARFYILPGIRVSVLPALQPATVLRHTERGIWAVLPDGADAVLAAPFGALAPLAPGLAGAAAPTAQAILDLQRQAAAREHKASREFQRAFVTRSDATLRREIDAIAAQRERYWAERGGPSERWDWALLGDAAGSEAGAARPSGARVVSGRYDAAAHPLAALFASAIGIEGATALPALHRAWGSEHEAQMAAKTRLLAPLQLAEAPGTAAFVAAVEALVCEVLAPRLALAAAGGAGDAGELGELCFQAFPCVRLQQPSARYTIRPHTDRCYNHARGTLNAWLPLTPCGDSATLVVESFPGADDCAPLPRLEVGELILGDMGDCIHFTAANRERDTRASLDVRLVTRLDLEADPTSAEFALGAYFSSCVRDADTGAWSVAVRGAASRQHGFPHIRAQ